MHVKKGGYAGRSRPGFNGSDPLRFGDIQREMDLARKQKNQGSKRKPFLVRSRLSAEVVRHFLPLMQVYLALCFEICC